MVRVFLVLGLLFGALALRAEDAPAPVCACKPMDITVRDASGRALSAVTVKNFAFTLQSLTVTQGDTVTWTNNDSAPHTVSSDQASVFDSGVLSMGASFSFTFNSTGSFPYHCNIHPFMTGSIVVVGPTPPALTNLTALAIVGVPFSYTCTATGTTPITYAATLPAGFQINNGVITGTFTSAGTIPIPITATNLKGADTQSLVVTVAASGGSDGDISGNWVGSLKGKHFEQDGPSGKPDNSIVTLIVIQQGNKLTATVAIAGTSFAATGQVGNKNLWLLGATSADSLAISAHLDKKGTTISGTGIRYNSHGDEEFTFSVKKR